MEEIINLQTSESNSVINNPTSSNLPPLKTPDECIQEKIKEILERLQPLRITSKTDVKPDTPVIWKVEGDDERVPLFPIRYVHLITARPKQGKSTFVRFIIGIVLMVKNMFGFVSGSNKPEKVLLIDTEHSKYDTKKIIEKLSAQTGVSEELIDEYVYIHHAQSQSPKELIQTLCDLLFAWNPKLVILDGCAQFVISFNNLEECEEFVNQLRDLSEKYEASIITVLHTNKRPDIDLPKGHLGSLLFQYCCTNVLCDKTQGSNIFKVKDLGSRHAPFSDFEFYIDKKGLICDASEIVANMIREEEERKKQERIRKEQEKLHKLKVGAITILNNAGGTMKKNEFLQAIASMLGKQSKSCYEDLNSLIENKVITESRDKLISIFQVKE